MEATMMAVASIGVLLYVILTGMAVVLLVGGSLVGLLGGLAHLLQELAGWTIHGGVTSLRPSRAQLTRS